MPDKRRSNYVVWREGKAPDFVLEILSPSTKRKDIAEKPALYWRMGAQEYFQFDPDRRTEPRLAGWRFEAERRAEDEAALEKRVAALEARLGRESGD